MVGIPEPRLDANTLPPDFLQLVHDSYAEETAFLHRGNIIRHRGCTSTAPAKMKLHCYQGPRLADNRTGLPLPLEIAICLVS
jgi:hypothetical protein